MYQSNVEQAAKVAYALQGVADMLETNDQLIALVSTIEQQVGAALPGSDAHALLRLLHARLADGAQIYCVQRCLEELAKDFAGEDCDLPATTRSLN